MWIDYEKQWREEHESIEAEVKKLKFKKLVAEATELQHKNDWSGLRGEPMTRLSVMKQEYKKRTGKTLFVERRVYP